MRDASIGTRACDTSDIYGNNWERSANLNTYLNGDYYDSLTSTIQSQIVESSYYTDAVTEDNNDMQDQISDEKSTVSNVKIALQPLNGYIREGSNTNCITFSTFSDNPDIHLEIADGCIIHT